jgi:RNA polymerase sigma-70 factor, ECF subfamily
VEFLRAVHLFGLSARVAPAKSQDRTADVDAPTGQDALQREVAMLYDDHGAALLRYAASVGRNIETARDAVQEAFLRYYSHRSRGGMIETPRAWLYKVIFNYLVDQDKEPNVSLEHAAGTVDPSHSPHANAEASSLNERFEDILSPRELSCVRLRAEGLSYDEIGTVLGVRIGTVGALLARAVRKIKKELNRE